MDKPKLLPCPFCGGEARIQQCPAKGFRSAGTRVTFQVGCTSDFERCKFQPFSSNFDFGSERQAVEAWNTRTASPAAEQMYEALREIAGEELSGEANREFVKDDTPVHSFCVTFGMLRRARTAITSYEVQKND